jgi:hypothetical protein
MDGWMDGWFSLVGLNIISTIANNEYKVKIEVKVTL